MRYRRVSYTYALVLEPAAVATQTAWRPAADVYETPSNLSVTIEIPGVDPEELEVLLFENALVVEGQRRVPDVEAGGIYHAAEIRRGPLRAEIRLPARVDTEPVELRFELGMLFITLHKAEVTHGG